MALKGFFSLISQVILCLILWHVTSTKHFFLKLPTTDRWMAGWNYNFFKNLNGKQPYYF